MVCKTFLQSLIDCLHYLRLCPHTAYHLRQGDCLYCLNIFSVGALTLKRNICASCPHQHYRGMVARLCAGTCEVLPERCPLLFRELLDLAEGFLFSLNDRGFQCVRILPRLFWCHSKVCRREHASSVPDFKRLHIIAGYFYCTDFSAINFGFFDAIDSRHFLRYPRRRPLLHIGKSAFKNFPRCRLHLVELFLEQVIIFNLAFYTHRIHLQRSEQREEPRRVSPMRLSCPLIYNGCACPPFAPMVI